MSHRAAHLPNEVHSRRAKREQALRFKAGDGVTLVGGVTATIKQAGDVGNPYFDYLARHHQRQCAVLLKERDIEAKLP